MIFNPTVSGGGKALNYGNISLTGRIVNAEISYVSEDGSLQAFTSMGEANFTIPVPQIIFINISSRSGNVSLTGNTQQLYLSGAGQASAYVSGDTIITAQ